MTLTLNLKTTAKDVADNRNGVVANKKLLKRHTEEIAHKAGAHVEPIVEEHSKHIKELIEVTGAGGGGARMADLEARVSESMKGVKNCTTMVDGLKEQLRSLTWVGYTCFWQGERGAVAQASGERWCNRFEWRGHSNLVCSHLTSLIDELRAMERTQLKQHQDASRRGVRRKGTG